MITNPKQRILQSATRLFTERGYQHVSLRQVAAEAEVSVSLIIRHFTSKDALFLNIIDARVATMSGILPCTHSAIGEFLVTSILDSIDDPTSISRSISALLDATDSDTIREEVSRITTKFFVQPVMAQLQGDHQALRASLVVAQVTGLVTQLHKLQNPALIASDRHDIVYYYGRAIQGILDDR